MAKDDIVFASQSPPHNSVELTQPDWCRKRTCVCLNSSSAGSSGTIFKIQKVVKNHNHITFFFFFWSFNIFPRWLWLFFKTWQWYFLFSFFRIFIYLFGCLRSYLRHAGSFVAVDRLSSCGAWAPFFTACGIPNQGSNPRSPTSQSRFLTSGPPGKSRQLHNLCHKDWNKIRCFLWSLFTESGFSLMVL